MCVFSGLEDFTRSPGRDEQREGPLLVDAARHSLPLPAQLAFQSPTNNILELISCRDQHRQLHKGKVFPKTLCLGNLSIKWLSREDATYAFGHLKGFRFQVLACFFSRERSRLTSLAPRIRPERDLDPFREGGTDAACWWVQDQPS